MIFHTIHIFVNVFFQIWKIPEYSGMKDYSRDAMLESTLYLRFPRISCLPCGYHLSLDIRNMLEGLRWERSEYSIFLTLFFTEIREFISKSMHFSFERRYFGIERRYFGIERRYFGIERRQSFFDTSETSIERSKFLNNECLEVLVRHNRERLCGIPSQYIRIFREINSPYCVSPGGGSLWMRGSYSIMRAVSAKRCAVTELPICPVLSARRR